MNTPLTADEYLDIVDDNDKVIGTKKRSEVYDEGLTNFRVVNVFIINSKGELWIPRRTAHKRLFPLCLDVSMGGHVETGETYDQTLKREMQEELNIDIDKVPIKLLGHLTPHQHNVSAFMKVYELKLEEIPDYNKDNFVEYFWLTPQALFQKLKDGDKSKEDLPKLVKLFYSDKI